VNLSGPAYDVVPSSKIRRVTAKRLRASNNDKPQVTLHRTIGAGPLVDRLSALRVAGTGSANPTITSIFAVALVRALRRDPVMNSTLEADDELRHYDEVHLAVAIATDQGLITPVLRPSDLIDDVTASEALAQLGQQARAGSIKPEQLPPFTFTLTNLGAYGVEYFTPIVNPPNIGILGLGRSPIEGGRHLPLSLTFDHAAVDGIDGAEFLQRVAEEVEAITSVRIPENYEA
jgi:pyruvate dehydrogenase E2 component (dihydrolipoamide acetyltransferase)